MKIIHYSWAIVTAIALFTLAAPSYAGIIGNDIIKAEATVVQGGGIVIPAKAEPRGYSLSRIASATAAFNVTDHSGTVPEVINGQPFQGLFTTTTNTFNVSPGTWLYVPIIQNDDSPPVIGNFPDVKNLNALMSYFYSHKEFGAVYTNITVDGKVIPLNEDYLVGVKVAPLPDGGGTQYMTVAAFLTPLIKGQHTVEISALASGKALGPWCAIVGCTPPFKFSVVYTVNVN